jgi:RNA polymerase sigma factor (sigma-70 family)
MDVNAPSVRIATGNVSIANRDMLQMVHKAQWGDAEALRALLQLVRTRLLGRLRSMLADDGVEDIVQNTLIRIAKHIKQYDSQKASFVTWTNRILHNELIRWLAARKKRTISILLDPDLPTPIRDELLARAQSALNDGHKVRFEVHAASASREETYRAEDVINECLADLDGWNNPPEIPFMKFDDSRFITQVASAKAKRLPAISLSRRSEDGESSADIDIPVEPVDLDDGEAASEPEIFPAALHVTLVSLVADKRLLRLMCEASYPWQVVIFCFNKLFVWKPKQIVKELSHQTLHSSEERLEATFSESFHHALGRLVELGVRKTLADVSEERAVGAITAALRNIRKEEIMPDFETLRSRMQMNVKSVLLKEDGASREFLGAILDSVIGETQLAEYFGPNPADSVAKTSDKVRKKVIELSVAHLKERIPSVVS